jgi:hypothetical protein
MNSRIISKLSEMLQEASNRIVHYRNRIAKKDLHLFHDKKASSIPAHTHTHIEILH